MATPVEHHTENADSAFSPLGHRETGNPTPVPAQHVPASLAPPNQRGPQRNVPRRSAGGRPVRGGTAAGLRVSVTYPSRDVVLIALAGELDLSTVGRVRDILEPRIRSTVGRIVLDLSQLTFLGVAGLGLLHSARHRADVVSTDLRLVAVTREVTRPLRLTGLDRLLACYPTAAVALECAGD